MDNKKIYIVVSLIVAVIFGVVGYLYFKTNSITSMSPENNHKLYNSENPSGVKVETGDTNMPQGNTNSDTTEVSNVKTSDAEIDKELNNLDQNLDLQVDEPTQ